MNLDNRDAVITIQGGGLFGLSLLGQLEAVIEKYRYVPLALAGSSAGAIVATLLWAGFPPSHIREQFKVMVDQDSKALVNLLGPFEPPKPAFDFVRFEALKSDIQDLLHGLRDDRSFCRRAIDPETWKRWWRLVSLKGRIMPHVRNRGIFRGELLEREIDELLRRAPDLPKALATRKEALCFDDFQALALENQTESYRPPLLLTVTNLTKRRLEVISSVDVRYSKVSIARAVRASAGFPVFFRPTEIPECPDGGWFVDGGLVSNFPMWVFSDAFRANMQSSPTFRVLASKSWIRIGLRVVDDPVQNVEEDDQFGIFFDALVSMLMGRARNELEEILASRAGRSIVIKQPNAETKGPKDLFEFGALTSEKIVSMVRTGFDFADHELAQLGSPSIYSNSAEDVVRKQLEALVQKCLRILANDQSKMKLRANVFVALEDRLKLAFSYNMDSDGDRRMEFPDLQSGLTGFCYISRRPQVCNLEEVAKLRTDEPDRYRNLFGMEPELQGKVRDDRSWLASVPILDPYDLRFAPEARKRGDPAYPGQSFRALENQLDGAVLGVLNVDAGWNYAEIRLDRNPDVHFQDERIQAILGLMQSASLSIAEAIAQEFRS